MIITQTPFRMSFFGGGTDMESFFRENDRSIKRIILMNILISWMVLEIMKFH